MAEPFAGPDDGVADARDHADDEPGRRGPLAELVAEYPLVFCLVLTLALADVGIVVSWLRDAFAPGLNASTTGIVSELGAAALVAGVVSGLQWWDRIGLRMWQRDTNWLLAAGVAYGLLPLGAGVSWPGASTFAAGLVVFALVAVTEEAAFRGVMMRALAHRGPVYAGAVSAALFGVLHVTRVLFGADVPSALVLVATAGAAGLGYAGLRVATGSLWPPVIVHGIYNAAVFATPTGPLADAAATRWGPVVIAGTVAFAVLGLWLLRRAGDAGNGFSNGPM